MNINEGASFPSLFPLPSRFLVEVFTATVLSSCQDLYMSLTPSGNRLGASLQKPDLIIFRYFGSYDHDLMSLVLVSFQWKKSADLRKKCQFSEALSFHFLRLFHLYIPVVICKLDPVFCILFLIKSYRELKKQQKQKVRLGRDLTPTFAVLSTGDLRS